RRRHGRRGGRARSRESRRDRAGEGDPAARQGRPQGRRPDRRQRELAGHRPAARYRGAGATGDPLGRRGRAPRPDRPSSDPPLAPPPPVAPAAPRYYPTRGHAQPRPPEQVMPTPPATAGPAPVAEPAMLDERPIPRAGWRVIAAKELGDHIVSVRFMVLLIIL